MRHNFSVTPGLSPAVTIGSGCLRRLAMCADAGDLNDRGSGYKTRRPGSALDGIGHGGRCCFPHGTAFFADQEHDRVTAVVIVHAGDKRIAALDPVHEPLLAKKIQRAIDRDWRGPPAALGQPVDEFVGPERVMARQQRLQHVAPYGREPLPAGTANRFGVGNRLARAAVMIMAGLGKGGARR
jgi:hypothetical protein